MLKIEAIASVTCTCELTDKEEQKVLKYINDNQEEFEYMTAKEKIIKAVEKLYSDNQIGLYENSVESDFNTDEIRWSEFEEKDAEDILEQKED